ncbi:MATE family efflux transporter [Bradyrhizobium sp. SZCCHNR2020]|uniref:MATE family efflux transporter n=1 Tax=unclassified Bradyrhizobium TaxID=2631580 RepID=UPI00396788F3
MNGGPSRRTCPCGAWLSRRARQHSHEIAPLVGQSGGNRAYDRVASGASPAIGSAAIIGVLSWIALSAFADHIGRAVSSDELVSALVAKGLSLYPIYMICSPTILVSTSAYNASGNAMFAMMFVTFWQRFAVPALPPADNWVDFLALLLG